MWIGIGLTICAAIVVLTVLGANKNYPDKWLDRWFG